MLLLVVGPSGAGKDTLLEGARALLAGDARVRFVRREITRPADAGGEAHEPIETETFALRRAAGAYALAWEAHGLCYGIPSDIALDIDAGLVVVANVSRGAVAEAARRFPVQVVEVTAPPDVLAARLGARGREAAADVAARLARAVALPEGVPVTRIVNDAGVAEGIARLAGLILSRAESAPRS